MAINPSTKSPSLHLDLAILDTVVKAQHCLQVRNPLKQTRSLPFRIPRRTLQGRRIPQQQRKHRTKITTSQGPAAPSRRQPAAAACSFDRATRFITPAALSFHSHHPNNKPNAPPLLSHSVSSLSQRSMLPLPFPLPRPALLLALHLAYSGNVVSKRRREWGVAAGAPGGAGGCVWSRCDPPRGGSREQSPPSRPCTATHHISKLRAQKRTLLYGGCPRRRWRLWWRLWWRRGMASSGASAMAMASATSLCIVRALEHEPGTPECTSLACEFPLAFAALSSSPFLLPSCLRGCILPSAVPDLRVHLLCSPSILLPPSINSRAYAHRCLFFLAALHPWQHLHGKKNKQIKLARKWYGKKNTVQVASPVISSIIID